MRDFDNNILTKNVELVQSFRLIPHMSIYHITWLHISTKMTVKNFRIWDISKFKSFFWKSVYPFGQIFYFHINQWWMEIVLTKKLYWIREEKFLKLLIFWFWNSKNPFFNVTWLIFSRCGSTKRCVLSLAIVWYLIWLYMTSRDSVIDESVSQKNDCPPRG